jgi:hypothetical protein
LPASSGADSAMKSIDRIFTMRPPGYLKQKTSSGQYIADI